MKNTSFLAIFDTLFILSLLGFLLTKNSAIFFVSLPFYVGTSFSQYFKQKEKLDNYFYNDFSLKKIPLDNYKQIATQKVKKLNEQIEQGLDIFEIISGNKY